MEMHMSYWSLLKMSEYFFIMLFSSFPVSSDSFGLSTYCTGLFICTWSPLVMKSSNLPVPTLLTCCFLNLNWWIILLVSLSVEGLPSNKWIVPMC